jgi:hypothetical protein
MAYFVKWHSVMETHVITTFTNSSLLFYLLYRSLDGVAIKLLIFFNLKEFSI